MIEIFYLYSYLEVGELEVQEGVMRIVGLAQFEKQIYQNRLKIVHPEFKWSLPDSIDHLREMLFIISKKPNKHHLKLGEYRTGGRGWAATHQNTR